MRLSEIDKPLVEAKPIKPIKPLTPEQTQSRSTRQGKANARVQDQRKTNAIKLATAKRKAAEVK